MSAIFDKSSSNRSSVILSADGAIGAIHRRYRMEADKPWEKEVEEILKLVDSGAFHSVYEEH